MTERVDIAFAAEPSLAPAAENRRGAVTKRGLERDVMLISNSVLLRVLFAAFFAVVSGFIFGLAVWRGAT